MRRAGSIAGGLARTEEAHLLAALALGFAIKQGILEKVPRFLGMGPVTNFGVVTYVLQKMNLWRGMPDIVRDAGRTARVLAAFQLGKGEALAGVGDATEEWGSEFDSVRGSGGYAAYG